MQRKEGVARGSSTWCFTWGGSTGLPFLMWAGWGPGLQRLTLAAGVRFARALAGTHLQRAQHPAQEGFRKTWPPACKPHDPECFRKARTATYILSPPHTAAYIISTTARGEIYIDDPLSFFLLKAAGYTIWQPGSWWYSSHSRSKGDASAPHAVPSPGLCPIADQAHFYSSLKRHKSNL